jgi:LPS sulfotransferase NodH
MTSPKPAVHYIICTNPRSGSWLLSVGLASTGAAGNPREWFNPLERQRWAALWRLENDSDLTPEAYLRLVRAKSATANGVAGLKLHHLQLDSLRKIAEPLEGFNGLTPVEAMKALFPEARYIWLRRRDKIRQAISLQLAFETREWWSVTGARPVSDAQDSAEPMFDPHAIARCEAVLRRDDARWSRFFRANGIEPLVVHYEDLAADYVGSIRKVIQWLGVAGAADLPVPQPHFQRQSSARNEAWRQQYLAFRKAAGASSRKTGRNVAEDRLLGEKPGPLREITDLWKQWIAQSRVKGWPAEAIVAVLVDNGHDPADAREEVARAAAKI